MVTTNFDFSKIAGIFGLSAVVGFVLGVKGGGTYTFEIGTNLLLLLSITGGLGFILAYLKIQGDKHETEPKTK
jgi:hypothetical protein